VVAQIPFNGFPRARDRSAAASLRLLAAILWDALRGRLGASPAYIPMIGRPGEVAVISTDEAQRHLATLAGDAARPGGTTSPLLRDRALADQLSFLREHLHASPRAA
jgi:hypothetical protein